MALTLENALKFGGLFGSTVIAGARGIGKPVENISVLEIADSSISKWKRISFISLRFMRSEMTYSSRKW